MVRLRLRGWSRSQPGLFAVVKISNVGKYAMNATSSTAIKPIETRYKGYRFRSRLEARWAVCFDALGLTWEYESEGYRLATGNYLPDFWFPRPNKPKQGQFVEIKPHQIPSQHEVELCIDLAQSSSKHVMIYCGDPMRFTMIFICKDGKHFVTNGKKQQSRDDQDHDSANLIRCLAMDQGIDASPDAIRFAQVAARGARFEFGETPNFSSGRASR